jgi:uncharacterized repeat protein (TIGR03803 family)
LLFAALAAGILALVQKPASDGAQDSAPAYSVLHNFSGVGVEGPYAGLIADREGNFYGTTFELGTYGFGTVFELEREGQEKILHNFSNGADGGYPAASLIMDGNGNLYGTTEHDGDDRCSSGGCGLVFELAPAGNETVLHGFTGEPDGAFPAAALLRDGAGNLYGTTMRGGAFGYGTVFKLDSAGNESVLYSFTGGADGGNPVAALVQDTAGNLYGTASFGGLVADKCGVGCGVVFKLEPSGRQTVLYSFSGVEGGFWPRSTLIRDEAGNLYGTTLAGGVRTGLCRSVQGGCGVVFKLDTSGLETVLHVFDGTDGAGPNGLIQNSDGNFYGTTEFLGRNAYGTVFELNAAGVLTTLHAFGLDDADNPQAPLLPYRGALYGTTADGGLNRVGAVFKITLQ